MYRYGEERAEFAARLREPEDGCATCGFWRDSLENCKICDEVTEAVFLCALLCRVGTKVVPRKKEKSVNILLRVPVQNRTVLDRFHFKISCLKVSAFF